MRGEQPALSYPDETEERIGAPLTHEGRPAQAGSNASLLALFYSIYRANVKKNCRANRMTQIEADDRHRLLPMEPSEKSLSQVICEKSLMPSSELGVQVKHAWSSLPKHAQA